MARRNKELAQLTIYLVNGQEIEIQTTVYGAENFNGRMVKYGRKLRTAQDDYACTSVSGFVIMHDKVVMYTAHDSAGAALQFKDG